MFLLFFSFQFFSLKTFLQLNAFVLILTIFAWSSNLIDSLDNVDSDLVPVGALQSDEVSEEQ